MYCIVCCTWPVCLFMMFWRFIRTVECNTAGCYFLMVSSIPLYGLSQYVHPFFMIYRICKHVLWIWYCILLVLQFISEQSRTDPPIFWLGNQLLRTNHVLGFLWELKTVHHIPCFLEKLWFDWINCAFLLVRGGCFQLVRGGQTLRSWRFLLMFWKMRQVV